MNLRLSCWAEGLIKRVDALAVLTLWRGGGAATLLGRTEVVANTTSPDWTKSLVLTDYELGEEPVVVVISLYDDHTGSRREKSPLGSVSFEIGTVIASAGAVMAKELKNSHGMVALRVEEINEEAGQLHVQLRGWNLKNLDGLGFGLNKSDPFFEILRQGRDKNRLSTWDAVYRSKALENNLNPIWPELFLDLDLLGTDISQAFRISVWDENKNGKHELIGSVDLTVQDLVDNVNDTVFQDTSKIDTTKSFALKNVDEETGKLLVVKAEVTGLSPQPKVDEHSAEPKARTEETAEIAVDTESFSRLSVENKSSSTDELKLPAVEPTFVNYIAGGCQLRVIVAIDCTQSNGNPSDVTSLHYCSDDGIRNEYEQALYEICSSLSKFDSDQLYPVFGFGAKSKDGTLSHCFPFGADGEHAVGVDGILKVYRETFRSGIDLSMPKNFGKVIRVAGEDAKKELSKGQAYSILLIFTNGGPNSHKTIEWSKAAVKEVDDAPLSVVIVGVGKGGGFVNSKKLAEPVEGSRNKVTFVRYQKNKDANTVAKAALHNIPAQLEQYFVGKEIYPQPESESEDISVEPYDEAEEVDVPVEFSDAGEVSLSRSVEVHVPRGNFSAPRKGPVQNKRNTNRRKMKKNNDPLGLNKVKGVKEARAAIRQARQIRRQAQQAKMLFQQVGKLF